jgi:hypothetical protein
MTCLLALNNYRRETKIEKKTLPIEPEPHRLGHNITDLNATFYFVI